jgi:hypothetical protein
MKNILALAMVLAVVFWGCDSNTEEQESDAPFLQGPYLGMPPPGDVPELFAPGIVSDAYNQHSGAVFTLDGNELFWSTVINEGRTPRIVVILHMEQENGVWTQPELAPFNLATYNHINSVSPDGKRLYFFSEQSEQPSKAWVVDKTDKGWGEPRLLRPTSIDSPGLYANEVHEARSGNLYLYGHLDTLPGGKGIVRSRFVEGEYQKYESLGPNVNFPHNDPYPNHSPTVDPDERFVIFVSRRPGGFGTQDLYISYRQPDGTWGPAINLGPEINTIGVGNSWPQLSPDGKFLFFVNYAKPYNENDINEKKYSYAELIAIQESILNGWGNIYWVDTSFVEKLKPANNE